MDDKISAAPQPDITSLKTCYSHSFLCLDLLNEDSFDMLNKFTFDYCNYSLMFFARFIHPCPGQLLEKIL